jgi:putative sugar O-methyltransferase
MSGQLRNLVRPITRTRVGRRAHNGFGEALISAREVEAFDRPAWLYRSRRALPSADAHYRPARPVTDADVALCQRLIKAYDMAQTEAPSLPGIWSHDVFQHRQRELGLALQQRDARRLAEVLASMFRSEFVRGMAPGSEGVTRPRIAVKFACLKALNKVVALAESQGAVRVENPEQGSMGIAFADGVESLVKSTEASLGVSLDFPDVGAPYGILVAGRLVSWDTPDHLYAAARLKDAMRMYLSDRDRPLHVIEIGGGYGAMAFWLLQMTHLRYSIVDLPLINVLQGYFLTQTLGPSDVSLYGEAPKRVTIVPTHALSGIDLPFDVLANKDSMPEIPEAALLDYLSWAQGGCDGIFYSYNHESATWFEGTPQNVVANALTRVGGFVRVRRDTSWLRRGYVEEVYRPVASTRPASA